jgi:D-arabinose 1-dehydrogenase-like Zn-dependent alcohol dehydrogenase
VSKGGSIGIVGIGGLVHMGTQVAKCMVRSPSLQVIRWAMG